MGERHTVQIERCGAFYTWQCFDCGAGRLLPPTDLYHVRLESESHAEHPYG